MANTSHHLLDDEGEHHRHREDTSTIDDDVVRNLAHGLGQNNLWDDIHFHRELINRDKHLMGVEYSG